MLLCLPSLSLLGTWLVGRWPVFLVIALCLALIAVWDWYRFFDRSRTMISCLALSAGLLVSGGLAALLGRPDALQFGQQILSNLTWIALTVALVQLYRNEQTVLTIVRGWMYAVAILAAITIYQRATRDLPALSGPFPSPAYLGASMAAGALLMPIGFALEADRRLRWAYPVAALAATGVVWTTHRSVAFGCCLAVLLIWLATYRWQIAALVAGLGAVAAAVFHSAAPLRWADVGMEPPLDNDIHQSLIGVAWQILQDSHFLGVGPGGLGAHWPAAARPYAGPYSLVMEVASQYGLAITVALVIGLAGGLVWCLTRLRHTRGLRWHDRRRAPALWVGVIVVSLPVVTMLQARWLDFPLSALMAATLALLARHIEPPQGRALVWSAGPGAEEVAGGPPLHDAQLGGEADHEDRPAHLGPRPAQPGGGPPADQGEQREPPQHGAGHGEQPELG
jgi:hypothetical protein